MPVRVQLRRTKGWRKPPNTISVARPSKWGNPYRFNKYGQIKVPGAPWTVQTASIDECRRQVVRLYAEKIAPFLDLEELRGKNLACWCPLEDEHGNRVPCHADVLLELANPWPPALGVSKATTRTKASDAATRSHSSEPAPRSQLTATASSSTQATAQPAPAPRNPER